jgi:selenocysteine lyase/cysteine desulfurase
MARTQLSDYRSLFPVTEELIYLNHAGVAPISLRVKEAVESFLEQSARWGILGIEKLVRRGEAVRRTIATCLGADSDEIAFVRSTSHGLALVAEGIDWQVGDNVITALDESRPPGSGDPSGHAEGRGNPHRRCSGEYECANPSGQPQLG